MDEWVTRRVSGEVRASVRRREESVWIIGVLKETDKLRALPLRCCCKSLLAMHGNVERCIATCSDS